jgi:hypothetical protein
MRGRASTRCWRGRPVAPLAAGGAAPDAGAAKLDYAALEGRLRGRNPQLFADDARIARPRRTASCVQATAIPISRRRLADPDRQARE